MSFPPEIFRGAAEHPDLWQRLATAIDRHAWSELADARMHELTRESQRKRELQQIEAATLVIVGTDDMPAFKRTAELLRRAIPACSRVRLTGGHLSMLENPRSAAVVIRDHLQGTSRSAGE